MLTQERFRAALEHLRALPVLEHTQRPAFGYRPPAVRRRPPRSKGAPGLLNGERASLDASTLTGAANLVAQGAVSAADLVRRAYAAIEAWNPHVNAFEYLLPYDDAMRTAALRDVASAATARRGPLWGLPITVKDVIHASGMPTTGSSDTLAGFVPTEDAHAVARLKRAGAMVIGKVTTHEYALGVTTPRSRNPWDTSRDPGGSSGGSAVSLATGMCLGSLGTDTRASIRVPAALCGVVGFKPTFGLVSTHGVLTLSWSMDHVAPMARTIEDVALLLNVLVGPDGRSPRAPRTRAVDYRGFLHTDVAGLRVGAPTHGVRNAEAGVVHVYERALATLREAGAVVVEVPEPTVEDFETVNAAGLIVSRCEAAAFHRTLVGRNGRYTAEVRDQLLEAEKVLAVDYVQAQRLRAKFADRMAGLFEHVDALALPTSRVIAPRAEESEQYLLVLSENCVPWSLIGFPAVSVPGGLAPPGLPVGIQLVGAPYDDGLLIALGSALADRLGPPPSPPRPAVGRADSC